MTKTTLEVGDPLSVLGAHGLSLRSEALARHIAINNLDLVVACVVGDGEAETGPLATACTPTSSSIRPTARCCLSCISTATRFLTRRSSPASGVGCVSVNPVSGSTTLTARFACLAMSGSSALVAINALMLKRTKLTGIRRQNMTASSVVVGPALAAS